MLNAVKTSDGICQSAHFEQNGKKCEFIHSQTQVNNESLPYPSFFVVGGNMGDMVFTQLIRQTDEHIDALVSAIGRLDKRLHKCKHTHEMMRAFALMSEASAARRKLLEKLIKEDQL